MNTNPQFIITGSGPNLGRPGTAIVPVSIADVARSVTVQADGKTVVAGYSVNASYSYDFSLIRLNANGSLDTSFNGTGKAIIDVGGSYDFGQSVTVQSDGKIVVAGYSVNAGGNNDFSLIRLNANGSLDTSFNGTGKAIIDVGGSHDVGQSVTLQSDGKIVVAGYSVNASVSYDFSLIRLNANGSLDTSFNGTGKAIIDVGSSYDQAYSVTLQSDGKIVVAGYSVNASGFDDFSLIRLNANGSLDTSFNGTGKAIIDAGGSYDYGRSVTLQSDGKIVVAGYSVNAGGNNDFSLIRLNANGSLDTSFNGTGKAIIDVGGSWDLAYSVTLQSDGKIVVAGNSVNASGNYDFSLIRLNANGSLDTSFNGTGKAIIPVGSSNDEGHSVTLQSDGKIVLAGNSVNASGNYDFSLIRLNANGTLDTTFNPAASSLGGNVAYTENASAIALDSSAAIVDAELGALNSGLGNYAGASVTLARHGGADAHDLFSALGNMSFSAGNVVLSGTTIGTLSNSAGTLVITFNSSATQAVVDQVLSSIGYANSSDAPTATVQVDWTFSDGNTTAAQGAGGVLTGTGSSTVNITAVNDAPTGVVTITGIAATGQTLTASNTLADADGLGAISYQWQADGVNINGATGAAYTLSAAELGKQVTVQASYTDGGNTHETVASAGTQLVVATNTSPQFSVSPNLGNPGTALIPVGYGGGASGVVVQADGKIVMAGTSYDANGDGFTLIRTNADGSLDSSFNDSGKCTVNVTSGGTDTANSLTLQSDGKIVVAGSSYNGNDRDFSLIRLNANGSLDTSFNGNGKAVIPIGNSNEDGNAVIVQSDGKIVVAGYSSDANWNNKDFSLIRLNADGSLDTSFNGTGEAIIQVGSGNDYGQSVALQSDGKIVVAGYSYDIDYGVDFSLIRLNADGSLDTSFNGTGKAIIPVGAGEDRAYSVTLQSDGKIMVAGTSTGSSGYDNPSLIRLNADGSLDTSFNGTGMAIIPVGAGDSNGKSVTLQSDGKIVVAGGSLIRLNADGSLDTSFNGSGKAIIPAGTSVTLQSDGKIVVAGSSTDALNNNDFSLVRLNADGSLDTSFNAVSNTLGGSVAYNEGARAIGLDKSVAIVDAELAATGNYEGASVTLARHGGADAQDVFSALGHLNFSASDVLLSGFAVGTLSNSAGTLTITFNNSATQVIVNEVLSSIGYANTSDMPPTSVQVDWTFNDGNTTDVQGLGGALTAVGSSTIVITSYTNTLTENTKLVTTVTSSDVLLGAAPKFTLSGEDAALFNISNKGVLTLKVVPDFEAPIDANHDGAYKVDVTLTNAKTHYAVTQNLVVGVNFAEIDGTAGADTLKGTKGWDTLDGKAGDDVLTGGDGLDTFIISAGHDTVKDFNVLGKTWTGPGAEVLQVAAGASVSATLKAAWSATSDTFNFGDGLITTSGLAVDLSGVTSGLGWDVLNKGKATTLTGSMFDDTLTAGSGNDVLQGGAGNDTLIGGKLADTLTGGVGADIFQLNGLKGIATAHHITDFVSGLDHIQLDSKIFKALGIGALSDSAWVDGTTATNSNQHILYNSSNGELFYDVDGSGKKAAVLIGVVDNHAALTHGDFLVV